MTKMSIMIMQWTHPFQKTSMMIQMNQRKNNKISTNIKKYHRKSVDRLNPKNFEVKHQPILKMMD